jgi:hypothetical protein
LIDGRAAGTASRVTGKEVGLPQGVLSAAERWRGPSVVALANMYISAKHDDRIHLFNSDRGIQIRGIDVRGDHMRGHSRAARGRFGVELTRGRGNSGGSGAQRCIIPRWIRPGKEKLLTAATAGCALQSQTIQNHPWRASQWQEVSVIARQIIPPTEGHRVAAGLAPCSLPRMH